MERRDDAALSCDVVKREQNPRCVAHPTVRETRLMQRREEIRDAGKGRGRGRATMSTLPLHGHLVREAKTMEQLLLLNL